VKKKRPPKPKNREKKDHLNLRERLAQTLTFEGENDEFFSSYKKKKFLRRSYIRKTFIRLR